VNCADLKNMATKFTRKLFMDNHSYVLTEKIAGEILYFVID